MRNYFLGANTASGFYSLFDELYSPVDRWHAYIIKGGPGTGKSGFMRKIAAAARENGFEVEQIFCSSDPASLDAVIIPELKTCVADGTSPHVIEPKYPGAVEEIINLGEFWNTEMLRKNSAEIIEKNLECSACHQRCIRFLSAFTTLKNDDERLILPCVDTDKLLNYVERTAAREFGTSDSAKTGHFCRRFLSAVTPNGINCFQETVYDLCDRVVMLDDDKGAVSSMLLGLIMKRAMISGYDVIACPCISNPAKKLDHLIIPSLRLCFFTENSCHTLPNDPDRLVNVRRFLNIDELKEHKARLNFNQKAASDLLDEAVLSLSNAKAVHDELEQFYIPAMDFDAVEEKAQQVIERIFN